MRKCDQSAQNERPPWAGLIASFVHYLNHWWVQMILVKYVEICSQSGTGLRPWQQATNHYVWLKPPYGSPTDLSIFCRCCLKWSLDTNSLDPIEYNFSLEPTPPLTCSSLCLFYRYFGAVYVCFVREGWHETRIHNQFTNSQSLILGTCRLCILEKTEIDISLHQQFSRWELEWG